MRHTNKRGLNAALCWLCAGLMTVGLAGCGGGGAGEAATDGAISAAPQKVYRWKMVTTWPPNLPIFSDSVENFAEDLEVLSGGRLKIDVFSGGELVPALEVFDAVTQGIAEMGHGSGYYWAGKVPAAQFFSTVPFGLDAQGMHAWLYAGDGLELWRETYRPYGVVPFPMGNSGQQMGGWFNRRIESVDDLADLRMRIPGLGGKVFERAGGSPVLFSGGDLFVVLERKNIDAAEWVGPFHDTRLGLQQAADYYYYPGWQEPGTAFELLINQKAWDSLPPDLQKLIEVTAAATDLKVLSAFDAANAEALIKIEQEGKVELVPYPDEVVREMKRLTAETLAEIVAEDPTAARVYEHYAAFQAQLDRWREVTSEAIDKALED